MAPPGGWVEAALLVVERIPLLGQLSLAGRRGLVVGGLGASLFLLLIGSLLGAMNRDLPGALIGGLCGAAGGLALGALVGALVGPLFYQPDSVDLNIRLDEPSSIFRPGSTLRGHILIAARRNVRVERGDVYFLCRGFQTYDELDQAGTEEPHLKRDTLQYLVQSAEAVPSRIIRRGTAVRYPFEFTIPDDALPTQHGNLWAVRWTLHAELQIYRLPPIRAHREIHVMARPPEVPRTSWEYRSMASSEACQVILSLPRVLYAPAESIEGSLRVTPKQGQGLDEIRVILLRIEHVPVGDDHVVYVAEWDPVSGMFRGERREGGGSGTTYIWLEDEAILDQQIPARTPQTLVYTFALPIPDVWRPTFNAADGDVTWKIGAVVSTRGVQTRAFHEVVIHTQRSDEAEAGAIRMRRVSA